MLKSWWARHKAQEDDLAEEFRSHLAIEARLRTDAGESSDAANAQARRQFGNMTGLFEETRETWGWAAFERFFEDLRFGLRMLRKSPVWTITAGVTLAAGIGLTTAVFSLVYSVLLQPLPFREPARLMALWLTTPTGDRFNVNPANWRDWKEQNHSFSAIALTRPVANFNLTGIGEPERLQGARTSWNLFDVLGMPPLLGRGFTEEEDQADAHVAVLSYGLWQRRFGRDPGIVGRKIELNGAPYEVIGVMPASFQYPTATFELWTPLYIPPDMYRTRTESSFISVGRLRAGVTPTQAQSDISRIMRRLAEVYPVANKNVRALVTPLIESMGAKVHDSLYVLLAASLCLLCIGCMNLSVLLIGRANVRAREMSLRSALGASGGRLSRQILAEVLPFSLVGLVGGVLLALLLLQAARTALPPDLPRTEAIALHWPVLIFSAAITLAVVLLASILPARMASTQDPARALQRDSRSVSSRSRVRDLLVIGQLAVALVLVFGASLLTRSLVAILQVNPGFSTEGVLTMHLALTRARYPTDHDVAEYYRRLVDRVASIPGVLSTGFVNRLPMSGNSQVNPIAFERDPDSSVVSVDTRSITPDYFNAMGIPLLRGRTFTWNDSDHAPLVVIIDDALARREFGAANPLGRRLRVQFGNLHEDWFEIVGVTGHIRNDSPEAEGNSQIYYPEAQRTQDRAALVVRTARDPAEFTSAVIRQIHAEDSNQPVYDVRTTREWLERTVQSRNLVTSLITLFGIASLVLACLGLYGVVSYTAGLRKREFGIRTALGATPAAVHRLVLRQAGWLAVVGCAVGLLCAWPASHVLQKMLFEVRSTDPLTLIGAPALLIAVAVLAGLGPAIRAAHVDPADTLRLD